VQAKQKRKERADPVASAKPDLGPVAAAQKGLSYPGMATSRSFAQHLFKNAVELSAELSARALVVRGARGVREEAQD